jgi:hypothetical protein
MHILVNWALLFDPTIGNPWPSPRRVERICGSAVEHRILCTTDPLFLLSLGDACRAGRSCVCPTPNLLPSLVSLAVLCFLMDLLTDPLSRLSPERQAQLATTPARLANALFLRCVTARVKRLVAPGWTTVPQGCPAFHSKAP